MHQVSLTAPAPQPELNSDHSITRPIASGRGLSVIRLTGSLTVESEGYENEKGALATRAGPRCRRGT